MFPLPTPFSNLPAWPLLSTNYPTVYLIDNHWATDPDYSVAEGSKATASLSGSTPLASDPSGFIYNHGEQTQCVIQYMARNLPKSNIVHVSLERQQDWRLPIDLPQAIHTIRVKPGDLVVLNAGFNNGDNSFTSDEYIGQLLTDLIKLGGIVVLSAGNDKAPLKQSFAINAVVVGGVDSTGTVQSRYGPKVTCYGVVPYNLPGLSGYSVSFDRSSAATAYTAGMVLMLLNYAMSTGRTLTSKQVTTILKSNSIQFPLNANPDPNPGTGTLPDWSQLQNAVDKLPLPRKS